MIFIIPRRRKKAAPRAMTLVPTFLYTWLFSAHSQAEQKQQKRNTSMSSLTTGGLNPINLNMETHKIEELSSVLPRAPRIKEAARTG